MTKSKFSLRLPNGQLTVHTISVWMIGIYMMFLPFEYVLTSEFGSISRYIGILIIGLCLISGKFSLKVEESSVLLICFLLYGVISGLWAVSFAYWSDVFFIYLKNAALFFAVTQCRFSRKQNEFIMTCYIIGAVLLLLYLLTSGNVYIDPYSGRTFISVAGGYFDPNYMAADIIMPIGYVYGMFYKKLSQNRYKQVIGLLALLLVLFYILILAGSRGAFLSVLVMLFCITVLNLKKKEIRRRVIWIALIIAVLAVVILQMLPEQIADRFSISSLTGQEDAGGARFVLWEASWKAIQDNFFFGYGAGCAIPTVGLYHRTDGASHSLYLSSVVEFGVFAGLLFYVIGRELYRAYRRRQYTEMGMVIGILTASAFLDALSTKFFWACLMLLFLRNRMEIEDET